MKEKKNELENENSRKRVCIHWEVEQQVVQQLCNKTCHTTGNIDPMFLYQVNYESPISFLSTISQLTFFTRLKVSRYPL